MLNKNMETINTTYDYKYVKATVLYVKDNVLYLDKDATAVATPNQVKDAFFMGGLMVCDAANNIYAKALYIQIIDDNTINVLTTIESETKVIQVKSE